MIRLLDSYLWHSKYVLAQNVVDLAGNERLLILF